MSGEALKPPGFFGKIPATGDFVSRGLSPGFVREWDRWLVRTLGPDFAILPEQAPGIRFVLGRPPGPAAGVIVASSDRHGRAFPLTVVAAIGSDALCGPEAVPWFDAIEDAALAARDGRLDAEALGGELAGIGPPAVPVSGGIEPGMALWIAGSDIAVAPPDRAGEALRQLLAARVGAA
jgi:type VI secretion system protein ImpM